MKILHTSDIHGTYPKVLDLLGGAHDVWVDSGDFFPNKTRGDRPEEVRYQNRFWTLKGLGARIVEALDGRPLISVGGNHDYIDLAALVREAGGVAYNVSDGPAVVGGLKFAGFREVPWIAGEWNGETHDFSDIVEKAMGESPDVLVTHGPASGLLDQADDGRPCGVRNLTTQLMYAPHNVKAHLFGHIHNQGESTLEEAGILFSNAATGSNTINL
jgi:Icc-related predicted phosphoesterase